MAPLKHFRFSFRELMLLPVRICNPPTPTVGKVRSCGVTPIFKVQLEDVLDRKHLPPLGLKDFEEWLLFVEQAPENLYFILWLREYRKNYESWATSQREQHHAIATSSHPRYQGHWPSYNSQLAQFYLKARQTFFSPQSIYELNLPADLLGPILATNPSSPHPDPAVFDAIAVEVQTMLKESLSRFVVAAYSNVGTNRGLCGVIVGTFVLLVCSIVPLVTAIMLGHSRWIRLTAFPGTWLGFTIMMASLHGVCLSVYVFGDVRQLRRFEMYPDPPRPKPAPKPVTAPPAPYQERPAVRVPSPAKIVISQPPPCAPSPPPSNRSHSSLSIYSMMYPPTESEDGYDDDDERYNRRHRRGPSAGDGIEISPEYYDDDPIEGPAISPMLTPSHHFNFAQHQKSKKDYYGRTFIGTASFIHPYSGAYEDLDDEDFETCDDDGDMFGGKGSARRLKRLPEECQLVTSFDFDELPVGRSPTPTSTAPSTMTMATTDDSHTNECMSITEPEPAVVVDSGMTPLELKMNLDMDENGNRRNGFEPPEKRRTTPRTILSKIQSRCTLDKWGSFVPSLGRRHKTSFTSSMMTAVQSPVSPTTPTTPTTVTTTGVKFQETKTTTKRRKGGNANKSKRKSDRFFSKEQRIALRFKLARAVPAFAAPLTRVLSPVVKRAQWEVVMRSAVMAFVCTWIGVGAMLAIPVQH